MFLFSVLIDAGVKQVLSIVLRVLFRFVLLLLTQGQQQRTAVFQSLYYRRKAYIRGQKVEIVL